MKPYYQDEAVTLYCGDCRDLLPAIATDVLLTDPPYGRRFRSGRRGAFGQSAIAGDESTTLRDTVLAHHHPRPALIFGSWRVPRPSHVRHILIWDKGCHVGMGDLRLPWKPNWEEIYVLGQGFNGPRTSSILRHLAIAGTVALTQGRTHPMEKPLPLMCDLLKKCPPGLVTDPFCGTGATLVAAKQLGRRAIGIELEERYCAIAAERLAATERGG